jgi:hypothetical protein
MELVVFVGPSLRHDNKAPHPHLQFRPPAAWGDVAAAAAVSPRAIGIIDGIFETAASSWHKEILWALSRGVAVFGAASIGALRAVELAPFGMIGCGRIYEAFRDHLVEDDDEVAVQHGPPETGYVNLTVAMVNIRATVEKASRCEVLTEKEGDTLTSCAKHLFYKDRTWDVILRVGRDAGLSHHTEKNLRSWLPGNEEDLKQHDARTLISEMLAWHDSGASSRRPEFPDTLYWQEMKRRVLPDRESPLRRPRRSARPVPDGAGGR